MVSHSSGAGYQAPDPILNDEVLQRLLSEAEAANKGNDRARIAISILSLIAIGGLTAFNPTLGMAAAPVISEIERILLSGEITDIDPNEFASLMSGTNRTKEVPHREGIARIDSSHPGEKDLLLRSVAGPLCDWSHFWYAYS